MNFSPVKKDEYENPKMLEIYTNQAWYNVFCYALAYREVNDRHGTKQELLFAIIGGADSAIQSMKAGIDIGSSSSLRFGHGVKENTNYRFMPEQSLATTKGAYEKFNMNLSAARKGVIISHQDMLNNRYLISFEKEPYIDVAKLLNGAPFGLWIEEDWKKPVFDAMIRNQYLIPVDMYVDEELFNKDNPLHLYEINLTEEQADQLISDMLKLGLISFTQQGDGTALQQVESLTDYILAYTDNLIDKVSTHAIPTHDGGKDSVHPKFDTYARELFPVQAHASTAIAKRLKKQKSVILQGEMSTGKSTMMVAISDGLFSDWSNLTKKTGYHVCLMSPPSLMDKWPKEIRAVIPNAKVHVIRRTEELIRYHTNWTNAGRPKPTVPTFFVIAYTTMRDGARIVPAVEHTLKSTTTQLKPEDAYKNGYYCPSCGLPHQTVESTVEVIDEETGEVKKEYVTTNMTRFEFGASRRLTKTKQPPNAFCFHCGDSLWTNKVSNRFESFKAWSEYEKTVMRLIDEGNVDAFQEQPKIPSKKGFVRRVAAIEYIRRKMKNFFDISIVDEVHMCKADNSAQGNALGSLAAASKKVIAGTGTLFGGKAQDIYFLLWRLFPTDMVNSGYQYSEVGRFNEEYGNVEKRTFIPHNGKENSNTNSRGGVTRTRDKLLPGISPFIFGKYMMKNVVNVRLKDVWADPAPLIDTPVIFVPMNDSLKGKYNSMISRIEGFAQGSDNPGNAYRMLMDYGIAYPDNPFTMPSAVMKTPDGPMTLWEADHLEENELLPKEEKLQEIIKTEMSQHRKSIVYVRDTGSTVPDRDVRPRLKKVLEDIGAKVCILDTTSADTDKRSQWLEKKINEEGYDVCIVSQELVKVGLDLLCTPTIIFYQFSWSLFTINQAARRAWRIGQTQECRLFYLAYKGTMQETMSHIIASKNKATAAINGDLSSDGLSAMLGDDGDLRSLLLKSVKEGKTLKGSAEDWISQTTDRARELLANIGKVDQPPAKEAGVDEETVVNADLANELLDLFTSQGPVEEEVTAKIANAQANTSSDPLFEILEKNVLVMTKTTKKKSKGNIEGQLIFDLFA